MAKASSRLWIVAVALIVVLAAGWFGKDHLGSQQRADNTIRIGSVLPMTGSASVWGKNAKRGMDLALKEINAKGGVNNTRIEVIYEDSQSDATVAVSAFQKIIATDKVPVVIGDIASGSVLAMAPLANRNQVVLFSPGASSSDITAAGEYVFRNWQSDALEGDQDAHYASSHLRWNKVGVLYVNNAYGGGLAAVFEKMLRSLGGEVVAREALAQGMTDARAQLSAIARANPDGVYMPGYPPEMAIVLKQKKELGLSLRILSVQAFDDPEIVRRAGDAAEGVIYSIPAPPDQSDPEVSTFRDAYMKAYGEAPGVTSDTGYDAIRILASVFAAGARTGPQIQQALKGVKDFPGAAGITTFDENGDVARTFVFRELKGGIPVDAP